MRSSSSIFEKLLSKVSNGMPKNTAVAATMASGNLILCFCFNRIVKSLICGISSITEQSSMIDSKNNFSFFEILCQPNNSISGTIERNISYSSICGSISPFPSARLMKTFVSANTLAPFISYSILIFHAIKISFHFPSILLRTKPLPGWFFLICNRFQGFIHSISWSIFFNFNYYFSKFNAQI